MFIESRLDGKLLSVAVVDYLAAGPSAVYTFFEPDEKKRSLGTFAILQQIWLSKLYKKRQSLSGVLDRGSPENAVQTKFLWP